MSTDINGNEVEMVYVVIDKKFEGVEEEKPRIYADLDDAINYANERRDFIEKTTGHSFISANWARPHIAERERWEAEKWIADGHDDRIIEKGESA